jgi:hypothetical protein
MRYAVSLLLLVCACSSNSTTTDGGSCKEYEPPAGTDLTKPDTSFRNDVLPVFKQSCGLSSSCHGSPQGSRVFLGSSSQTTDPAAVRTGLVNVPSVDLPGMPLVTASDPKNSFLMHKMDGDLCALESRCKDNNCGRSMPLDSPVLDEATRMKVRRWIAQGAKDN